MAGPQVPVSVERDGSRGLRSATAARAGIGLTPGIIHQVASDFGQSTTPATVAGFAGTLQGAPHDSLVNLAQQLCYLYLPSNQDRRHPRLQEALRRLEQGLPLGVTCLPALDRSGRP
jgi:hypothetical protein